jgi:hypothetical protein
MTQHQPGGQNPLGGPRYDQARAVFRVVGPLVAAAGVLLIATSIVDFFLSMGTPGRMPRLFWCFFLGAPLLFVGWALTVPGYLGLFSRYTAGEVAPVQKDAFNYMARETAGGVRTVAGAVAEGLASAHTGAACPRCGAALPGGARFCPGCGAPFAAEVCAGCGGQAVPGAKFCH